MILSRSRNIVQSRCTNLALALQVERATSFVHVVVEALFGLQHQKYSEAMYRLRAPLSDYGKNVVIKS
jgi:hypothetical protein